MKRWKLRIGIGALVIVVIVVVLFRSLARWFGPDTYGVATARFVSPEKAAAVSTFVHPLAGPAPKPNLVVILADDLGYGDLGCLGNTALRTPNMDRLASEGMRFTSFYAAAPVCSPSRAGLLTGRYPLRSGIITALPAAKDSMMRTVTRKAGIVMAQLGTADMAGGENAVMGLPPSEITIAEALQVAGYRTGAVGKWHLGDFSQLPEYHPFNHGFDDFTGFNMSNDDWPVAFYRGNKQVVADIGTDQEQYTGLFTQEAIRFIEQNREQPFFLYLAHKDPHQPFFPSATFAGSTDAGPYGDAVAEFDGSVGDIVAALQRLGIAENTLVIVTSDNGPWFEGNPGGLRGRKGQSYEGGFRVPFIAWWPNHIPAGRIENAPVMGIDIFPTALALAGLGLPKDRAIDGCDLWPLLSGQSAPSRERPLYFFHDYDIEAVRSGDWKYIRSNSHYVWPVPLDKQDNLAGQLSAGHNYVPADGSSPVPTLGAWPLLYNLARDPSESYNVVKRHPDVAHALEERIMEWRGAFYDNPRGWR